MSDSESPLTEKKKKKTKKTKADAEEEGGAPPTRKRKADAEEEEEEGEEGGDTPPTRKRKAGAEEDGGDEVAKKPRARSTPNRSVTSAVVAFNKKIDKLFPDGKLLKLANNEDALAALSDFWNDSHVMIGVITGTAQTPIHFIGGAGNMNADRATMLHVYSMCHMFKQHMARMLASIAAHK